MNKISTIATKVIFTLSALLTSLGVTSAEPQDGAEVTVKPDVEVTASLTVEYPPGFHLNLQAPSKISLRWASADSSVSIPVKETPLSIAVPPIPKREDKLLLTGTIYICNDGPKGVCLIRPLSLEKAVAVGANGETHQPVAFTTALQGP